MLKTSPDQAFATYQPTAYANEADQLDTLFSPLEPIALEPFKLQIQSRMKVPFSSRFPNRELSFFFALDPSCSETPESATKEKAFRTCSGITATNWSITDSVSLPSPGGLLRSEWFLCLKVYAPVSSTIDEPDRVSDALVFKLAGFIVWRRGPTSFDINSDRKQNQYTKRAYMKQQVNLVINGHGFRSSDIFVFQRQRDCSANSTTTRNRLALSLRVPYPQMWSFGRGSMTKAPWTSSTLTTT